MLRAVVCDCVGPAECAEMLKLVKQPRSRRERGRWRATPGRSEEDSAPPPPAEDPSDRTLGCVPRVRGCAHAGCLGRASQGNPAALALETPREPTAAAEAKTRIGTGDRPKN